MTAMPTEVLAASATFVLPTTLHAAPFGDTSPVNVVPLRVSLNQTGVGWTVPARKLVVAPVDARDMNSIDPFGRTSNITCAEPADSGSAPAPCSSSASGRASRLAAALAICSSSPPGSFVSSASPEAQMADASCPVRNRRVSAVLPTPGGLTQR